MTTDNQPAHPAEPITIRQALAITRSGTLTTVTGHLIAGLTRAYLTDNNGNEIPLGGTEVVKILQRQTEPRIGGLLYNDPATITATVHTQTGRTPTFTVHTITIHRDRANHTTQI